MTYRQLLDRFGDSWITRAVDSGRITRVHRGVYVLGIPTGSIEQRCAAARLAGGKGSAVSHRSAAALKEIIKDDGGPIHRTLPSKREDRRGLRFHEGRLAIGDTVVVDGIRVTSPLRTLHDLGKQLTPDAFWRDEGIVAEIDHYSTHGDRLAFERDRRKRNHYTLNGLLVLQITEETLPGEVGAVRAALARRSTTTTRPG